MKNTSRLLANAVAAGDAPFLVAMAGTASGILHESAAGEMKPGTPASLDTVFRIFSQTKAVGAVAAMILIERGQLDFDTPVRAILPEFAELSVLEGFDGDEPRLRAQRSECTIAHLASHTSGLAYEHWNADIAHWLEVSGNPSVFSGKIAGLRYPLVADPGTEWHYGPGVDWLGRAVEAIDGRRIDAFCRSEIFEPLGMTDTRFELESDLEGRLCQAWSRGGDGFKPARSAPAPSPEFYGMGHALYSTAPDYMRFLRMVLNGGTLDGNRVLSSSGVETMLAARSGGLSVPRLRSVAPRVSLDFDPFPGRRVTHSMAWARLEEGVPGRRAAGSQHWAGALNTHCWLDPANGVAGLFMTQLAPWSDPSLMRAYETYERAVYVAACKS